MTEEMLRKFFRMMALIRAVEERIGELVEAGEVHCPCHLYIGQEAVAAGACAALRKGDTVWGTHRSHGHYLAMEASVMELFAEILGRVGGCSRGRGGSMHLFSREHGILGTVPIVAATIPIAVGAGFAAKMRRDQAVSVAFFGDGATEEGHFHESLNLAAVYKLPVIFVCENNLYASHLHLLERRPADNLDQMVAPYQMPSLRLDGNDVAAVYQATTEAVARARAGEGPSFLECRTFRWRGHVGPKWDMDVGVRRRDELPEWMANCPIARVEKWLIGMGVAKSEIDAIAESVRGEIQEAESVARQSPVPNEAELMEHVFCTTRESELCDS